MKPNTNFFKNRFGNFFVHIVGIGCIVLLVLAAIIVILTIPKRRGERYGGDLEKPWSYHNEDDWPAVCKGKLQSPVAIVKERAFNTSIPELILNGFDKEFEIEVTNTGHTVSLHLPHICKCDAPTISGANLPGNFTFDNIHFHWPSEHTLDGMHYDLEGHFVFYLEKYKSLVEALQHKNAVTVLAIMFYEINFTNSTIFDIIADAVEEVADKPHGHTLGAAPIKFYDFLPYDHHTFYRYQGSLTTPSCVENINWLVFKKHSNISYENLNKIKNLYGEDNELLVKNNRSLQDINNRTIYLRDLGD